MVTFLPKQSLVSFLQQSMAGLLLTSCLSTMNVSDASANSPVQAPPAHVAALSAPGSVTGISIDIMSPAPIVWSLINHSIDDAAAAACGDGTGDGDGPACSPTPAPELQTELAPLLLVGMAYAGLRIRKRRLKKKEAAKE